MWLPDNADEFLARCAKASFRDVGRKYRVMPWQAREAYRRLSGGKYVTFAELGAEFGMTGVEVGDILWASGMRRIVRDDRRVLSEKAAVRARAKLISYERLGRLARTTPFTLGQAIQIGRACGVLDWRFEAYEGDPGMWLLAWNERRLLVEAMRKVLVEAGWGSGVRIRAEQICAAERYEGPLEVAA